MESKLLEERQKLIIYFFADDSLIFCRDSFQDSQTIQEILNTYQSVSGQFINLDKSEISFSRNVPDDH